MKYFFRPPFPYPHPDVYMISPVRTCTRVASSPTRRRLDTAVSSPKCCHHHHKKPPTPAFKMSCSCGIGSSAHDHGERKPLPPLIQKLHSLTDKLHESIPIAVFSVSAALLASVPALLPLFFSRALVMGVYAGVGIPAIIHSGVAAYGSKKRALATILDVHSLMTLSAFAAFAIGKGPEGAFLLGLFQLAHAIQHSIIVRARKDVSKLAEIVPDTVQIVLPDGSVKSVKADEVDVGSRVIMRPSAVCPIDGILISSGVSVQLAHITGESFNIEKDKGSLIPAGAVNVSRHSVEIETVKSAGQSTLQRIVDMAQHAAHSRPKIASLIDEMSPKYSSAVLAGSAGIALGGPLVMGWSLTGALYTALSFLVAASPCALLVASPVAQAAAVSACSRKGIVLSGGAGALERFAKAKSIAIDKTGTVTEGRMEVVSVERLAGDQNRAMDVAAVLGFYGSTHPVSQGIGRGLSKSARARYRLVPSSVVEVPGSAVSSSVWDLENNTEFQVSISRLNEKGSTHSLGRSASRIRVVSPDSLDECIVYLEDKVRPGVKESLYFSPLPVFLMTGDNRQSALSVAKSINLEPERVFADMSPGDKAKMITQLPRAVMVGDGVNDTPALAAAPAGGVSIAASASSDSIQSAAVSVADAVVIVDESSVSPLESVNFLIAKSKQTSSLIKSNVLIALTGMVGTAAAVLVGGCPLWLAVVIHEGSTVLVVMNSLRNL